MSDHRERPRDPDPAALAELAEAFADEDDGDHASPAEPVDEELITARIDAVPSDDPDAAAVTSRVQAVRATPTDPEAEVVTSRVGAVPGGPGDRDAPGDPEAEVVTSRVEAIAGGPGDPDAEVVTSRVDAVPPAEDTPPSLAILDADLPDVERPDADSTLTIVEQEPPAQPAPKIIRIDDYGGSVEIDDTTPATPGPAPITTTAPSGPAPPDGSSPATISISDEEFPDAVYIEGSLDRDGAGPIVIIDDDDTGDALAPESERSLRRGIEPRMRERRLAVRRAQGRRRLKIVAAVVAAVLIAVLTLAALGTFFVVRAENVNVYNAVYTDEAALQEIIDDAVGTPVLLLDSGEYEERIEAIPWVERASVRTDFPYGLEIEIREREAISTYQGTDERFRVLDREGRVLDVLDLYPFAYVLIGGPDTPNLEPGEFAPQGFAAASELSKNLTATVRGRVQLIEVTSDGSRLVMYLDDGSTVFFGEARDLLAKLVRLEAVLINGQDREPGLIDVSTSDVTR